MGSRTTSLALAMLMLTGTLIVPTLADEPEPPEEEPVWEWPEPLPPQDDDVLGSSRLDIVGSISPSSYSQVSGVHSGKWWVKEIGRLFSSVNRTPTAQLFPICRTFTKILFTPARPCTRKISVSGA